MEFYSAGVFSDRPGDNMVGKVIQPKEWCPDSSQKLPFGFLVWMACRRAVPAARAHSVLSPQSPGI